MLRAGSEPVTGSCLIRFFDGETPTADYLGAVCRVQDNGTATILSGLAGARTFGSPSEAAAWCKMQAIDMLAIVVWASDPDRPCRWWSDASGEWRLVGPLDMTPGTLVLDAAAYHERAEQANRAAAFALIPVLQARAKRARADQRNGQVDLFALFKMVS